MKLLDRIKEANKVRKAKNIISSIFTFPYGPNHPIIGFGFNGGGTLYGEYTDWKSMFFVKNGYRYQGIIYLWSTPRDLSVCTDTVKTVDYGIVDDPTSEVAPKCSLLFSNGKTATLTPLHTSWAMLEEMFALLKVEEIKRSYYVGEGFQTVVEVKHFDGYEFGDWEQK